MSDFHVLIAGAGLGGLTLAQSLHRRRIGVRVFERDVGPFDRPQGYRLHLDADAIHALREVLTPELHALFEATSQRTRPYTTILAEDLSVIKRIPVDDDHGDDAWPQYDGPPLHANVDRATLRQILLAGLDGDVHYGKTLARYASDSRGVTAYFTDGTEARGDVLVGADGVRSAVRRQRAPHARTVDAGVTAIYGRVPLAKAVALVPSETLDDIFTIASDDRKVFLGLGTVRFPTPPDRAAATFAPQVPMRAQENYVVCIVGGRHAFFPDDVRHAAPHGLQRMAADLIVDWPDRAAAIVRAGEPSAFFRVEMVTSVPCELDPPTDVTLLGDAIHAMTPTLGRGANVAMRDGALLGRALAAVAAGATPLHSALARYERGLVDYGFAVVREAAELGRRRMAQNPLPD